MELKFNADPNPSEDRNQNDLNSYDASKFHQTRKPINIFESASLALATAAVFTCLFFYASYILGALAIVFSLLSRGGQMKLSTKAKFGLSLGIFAIIFTTILTIGGLYIMVEEYGSIENILREYYNMYNLDFEELYGHMF